MKCIAIDDEPKALKVIQALCSKTDLVTLERTFREPLEALSWIQNNDVDLIFLDINMPELSGYDFINTLNKKPQIIMTTAYSKYAVDSYLYNVTDYLLKPIELKRFLLSVHKANDCRKSFSLMNHDEKKAVLYVNEGTIVHKIKLDKLAYVESSGNYVIYHLTDRDLKIRQTLKNLELELTPKQFFRIHKSFIVSIDKIDLIESYQVQINKRNIPIGSKYRSEFLQLMRNIREEK